MAVGRVLLAVAMVAAPGIPPAFAQSAEPAAESYALSPYYRYGADKQRERLELLRERQRRRGGEQARPRPAPPRPPAPLALSPPPPSVAAVSPPPSAASGAPLPPYIPRREAAPAPVRATPPPAAPPAPAQEASAARYLTVPPPAMVAARPHIAFPEAPETEQDEAAAPAETLGRLATAAGDAAVPAAAPPAAPPTESVFSIRLDGKPAQAPQAPPPPTAAPAAVREPSPGASAQAEPAAVYEAPAEKPPAAKTAKAPARTAARKKSASAPEQVRLPAVALSAPGGGLFADAPEPGAAAEEDPNISAETQRIIDALPETISGRPSKPRAAEQVDISRVNPKARKAKEEEVRSEHSLNMDVSVKNRGIDISYELERAYAALMTGDTETAAEIYEGAVAARPDNQLALFGLATTYHRLGQLDRARPVYGRLLAINPYHKEALNNFFALVGEESPQEALQILGRLERKNPGFSPIAAQMALLYRKLGDYDHAVSYMLRATASAPENLVYKYNLAILYDIKGDKQHAAELYRQLIEARYRGQELPTPVEKIQERLTFLVSN